MTHDPAPPKPPAGQDGPRQPPGLQQERTHLARQRTALSFAAVAVLLIHAARSGSTTALTAALSAVAASGAGLAYALRQYHLVRTGPSAVAAPARWRYTASLAAVAAVLATSAFTVVLLSP
jgi:uncharacterized membrane protein YidH (DUF202 family)